MLHFSNSYGKKNCIKKKEKLIIVIKTIKSLKVYLYSKLKSQTNFSIFQQGHTKSGILKSSPQDPLFLSLAITLIKHSRMPINIFRIIRKIYKSQVGMFDQSKI